MAQLAKQPKTPGFEPHPSRTRTIAAKATRVLKIVLVRYKDLSQGLGKGLTMIERIPFGSTGHASSRVIFGAAALGGMKQDRADRVLEILLENGINHID